METENTNKENKNYAKVIAKAVLKIVLGLFLFVLLLITGLVLALRVPSVQTKAVQKVAQYISETIDHEVSIGYVDIDFFSHVVLDQVRVLDYERKEMFSIRKVDAAISAFSIFHPNRLTIDNLILTEPHVVLVKYKGTDSLNLSTFLHALERLIKQDTTKTSTFDFKIKGITLQNAYFVYDNQNEPKATAGMDYQHLVIDSIYGSLSDINFNGDTVSATIKGLRATERKSNAYLKKLDVRMTYAPTFWEYADMDLSFNDSKLCNYVRFDYRTFSNFTSFNDSVSMTTRLDSSFVTSQDIAVFGPQILEYSQDDKVLINKLVANGKVSDFNAREVDLRFGESSRIIGKISADGLPNVKETFAELQLRPSTVNARDFRSFIPAEARPYAERLGTVELKGKFIGFYNDFVADGSFNTALGSLTSDINLKFDENRKNSTYKGYLKTTNFHVGRLINRPDVIKTVSMAGRVEGRGFTVEDARVKLDATIQALHLYDYNYRNIVTNATLSRQTFAGDLKINDPNLMFNATANVDLSKSHEEFAIQARLEHANLQALRLTSKNMVLQTSAQLNFTGIKPDDIQGSALLTNALLIYDGRQIALDSIKVNALTAGNERSLSVISDLVTIKAGGNFAYSQLLHDAKTLWKEYRLNFQNDEEATAAYYSRKPRTLPIDYNLDFNIFLRHATPLLRIFVPELTLSNNGKIEGSFRSGNTTILSLAGSIDTIVYDKFNLYNNTFELNTSKLPYSNEVLASAFFNSRKQSSAAAGTTENFYVEGVWNERTIAFSTNVQQPNSSNRATISGNLDFLNDGFQVIFDQSTINLLGKAWNISPQNTIVVRGRDINFQNFSVSHNNQVISVLGSVSEDPAEKLSIFVTDFELQNLNPLLEQKVFGVLNADLHMSNVYKQLILSSQLKIDSFMLDEVLIGNVQGTSQWDNRLEKLGVNLDILRENMRVLAVTGFYNPYSNEQQLNLLASMTNAPFKLVEPFLKVVMHDLSGNMNGEVSILGRLNSPVLKGNVLVDQGRFTFTYLNTVYTFSDRVFFNENGISFRRIRLQDIYGNTAQLNGGVYHDGFQNMVIDLEATFTRFMVLNTTRDINELYYGQAFASGKATILGAPENLVLNVDARSEKGTRIYIPMDTESSLSRKNYIHFVNRNVADTAAVQVSVAEQKVDLSGISMVFNLDITEDAYAEIILNEATGDIIRGNGTGQIRMNIDTRGEFNMYGQYRITRGRYNFTFAEGVVGREFVVRPGGTITFNGDPLNANMNVTATYTQRTVVPSSLLGLGTTEGTVRLPVVVLMDLTGNILSPDIRLGLEFHDVPAALDENVAAYKSKLRSDEQELNRQVFSILVFKRMAEEGAAFGGAGVGDAALASTAGEIFSSMFSGWINQIDTNLEVDIGVGGSNPSDELLQDVELRVSYRLLKGRLRVTREGGITNADYGRTNQNSVTGDWTVEYYLRQDGKLRMLLEYRSNPTVLDQLNPTSTRVSLVHFERFDSFRELADSFTSLFKGKKARLREQQEEELLRPRYDIDNDERTPL